MGTLWRGVNVNLSATYIVDTIFRWWRFSSCTTDGKAREPPFSQAKRAVCDPWYQLTRDTTHHTRMCLLTERLRTTIL